LERVPPNSGCITVLHLGPHPHQLVPVHQQLPLIALGQRRHPLQIRKIIFPDCERK